MRATYEEFWEYISKTPELVEYLAIRYFDKTRCLLTPEDKLFIYEAEKYFREVVNASFEEEL